MQRKLNKECRRVTGKIIRSLALFLGTDTVTLRWHCLTIRGHPQLYRYDNNCIYNIFHIILIRWYFVTGFRRWTLEGRYFRLANRAISCLYSRTYLASFLLGCRLVRLSCTLSHDWRCPGSLRRSPFLRHAAPTYVSRKPTPARRQCAILPLPRREVSRSRYTSTVYLTRWLSYGKRTVYNTRGISLDLNTTI